MAEMDAYDRKFTSKVKIVPVSESYKAVQGQKPAACLDNISLRGIRNSWVQFGFDITCPGHTTLLLEERPALGHHYPPSDEHVLRAALDLPGLEGKLYIVEMTGDDDGVGKADVISTCGSIHMRPFRNHQLTALVDIPADTPPGRYDGTVRFYAHCMFDDERLVKAFPVSVQVENVTLPAAKDGKFYLNLWQHVCNIARKAEVRAFTPEHIEALRPYARALGELGNKVTTIVCSDAAWAGQMCVKEYYQPSDLYEYNFIRIHRDVDGVFHYDFSFVEAYIRLMETYGAVDVMLAGLYGIWAHVNLGFDNMVEGWADAIRVSYVDLRDGTLRFMRTAAEIEGYFTAIYRWIVDTGRLENCYLMGDETDQGNTPQSWVRAMDALNRLFPGVHRNWDNSPDSMMSETYQNERMDIYTPMINLYAPCPDAQKEALRNRLEPGGKLIWSVACWPPVMNSFLGTNLNEVRLHGLITEHLKMDGFIRWNFTVWSDSPRESLSYFAPMWPAGDTCFVYPGKGGQCLRSLRYLALRRGIEDFELCQMVKDTVPAGEAVVADAIGCVLRETDVGKWDFDNSDGREAYMSLCEPDYNAARDMLLDALLGKHGCKVDG